MMGEERERGEQQRDPPARPRPGQDGDEECRCRQCRRVTWDHANFTRRAEGASKSSRRVILLGDVGWLGVVDQRRSASKACGERLVSAAHRRCVAASQRPYWYGIVVWHEEDTSHRRGTPSGGASCLRCQHRHRDGAAWARGARAARSLRAASRPSRHRAARAGRARPARAARCREGREAARRLLAARAPRAQAAPSRCRCWHRRQLAPPEGVPRRCEVSSSCHTTMPYQYGRCEAATQRRCAAETRRSPHALEALRRWSTTPSHPTSPSKITRRDDLLAPSARRVKFAWSQVTLRHWRQRHSSSPS